ncbi:MAG: phage tail length tape measure family protein [Rhodocyclaceae bacterium]|nr:phage tail length tape measure family protein [Rhodocyclaceae bacterium]
MHSMFHTATGLTRNQLLTLQYTFNDVVASMSTGMSPMTILMQQAKFFKKDLAGDAGLRRLARNARSFRFGARRCRRDRDRSCGGGRRPHRRMGGERCFDARCHHRADGRWARLGRDRRRA